MRAFNNIIVVLCLILVVSICNARPSYTRGKSQTYSQQRSFGIDGIETTTVNVYHSTSSTGSYYSGSSQQSCEYVPCGSHEDCSFNGCGGHFCVSCVSCDNTRSVGRCLWDPSSQSLTCPVLNCYPPPDDSKNTMAEPQQSKSQGPSNPAALGNAWESSFSNLKEESKKKTSEEVEKKP